MENLSLTDKTEETRGKGKPRENTFMDGQAKATGMRVSAAKIVQNDERAKRVRSLPRSHTSSGTRHREVRLSVYSSLVCSLSRDNLVLSPVV